MKIDIDALFDEYLNEFIEKNGDVLSATDIEKKIADLYVEFGKVPCEELGGLSPIEYLNSLQTKELLEIFKEGIEDGKENGHQKNSDHWFRTNRNRSGGGV
jgi:hypothetical protein